MTENFSCPPAIPQTVRDDLLGFRATQQHFDEEIREWIIGPEAHAVAVKQRVSRRLTITYASVRAAVAANAPSRVAAGIFNAVRSDSPSAPGSSDTPREVAALVLPGAAVSTAADLRSAMQERCTDETLVEHAICSEKTVALPMADLPRGIPYDGRHMAAAAVRLTADRLRGGVSLRTDVVQFLTSEVAFIPESDKSSEAARKYADNGFKKLGPANDGAVFSRYRDEVDYEGMLHTPITGGRIVSLPMGAARYPALLAPPPSDEARRAQSPRASALEASQTVLTPSRWAEIVEIAQRALGVSIDTNTHFSRPAPPRV